MSEPYKYCYTCGGRLIARKRVWSYDGETGKPNVTYDYNCLSRRWCDFNHPLTTGDAYAMQA